MTKPTIIEFNVETQEEITREMNDVEYANHLERIAQAALEQQAEPDSVV